ncbi:hypothetical protein ANN_21166 [Periplaneta americana]|uniref:Uncharacterized protein n=1 Tax=Periplaneta americana TaxID=6978 RepID=A0ABQ8SEX1_PERAM|nr:hypothetical protein ANN_21166 [Periplaneta americana]
MHRRTDERERNHTRQQPRMHDSAISYPRVIYSPNPGLNFCVKICTLSQISTNTSLTSGRWLTFTDNSLDLIDFFHILYIPADSEFLVAQSSEWGWSRHSQVALTEVFDLSPDLPLQTRVVANWSYALGFSWTICLFMQGEETCRALRSWEPCIHRTEFIEPTFGTYGARNKKGVWNGVIGLIVNEDVDVGLNVLDYDKIRMDAVDYFPPLWNLKKMLHIKDPGYESISGTVLLLLPFSPWMWMAVLGAILTFIFLLPITWYFGGMHRNRQDKERYNLYNSTFYVMGIFCKQSEYASHHASIQRLHNRTVYFEDSKPPYLVGHPVTPDFLSCRAVYVTAYLAAIFLFLAYSDTFITHLTVRRFAMPFTDFQGFLNDGTYRVGMRDGSAHNNYFKTSKDPMMNEVYSKLIPPTKNSSKTSKSGLENVCKEKKYAFLTSHIIYQWLKPKLPCSVVGVQQAYYSKAVSMVINKRSPYKRFFNHHLLEMRRTGLIQHIMENSWPRNKNTIQRDTPPSVSLEMVAIIHAVLAVGILLSFLFLILECYVWERGLKCHVSKPTSQKKRVARDLHNYKRKNPLTKHKNIGLFPYVN